MSQSPYRNQKPDDPSKPYVFISYARSDAPEDTLAAEQIEEALVAAEIHCFRDVHMRKGIYWDQTIEKALKECDQMVLVGSSRSMDENRKEVYVEWFSFDQEQKTIYLFEIEKTDLHRRFKVRNNIDAINDREKGLKELLKSIQSTIDSPPNQIFDRFLAWYKSEVRGLDVSTNNLIDVFKDTFQSRFKSREELLNETEKIKSVEDLLRRNLFTRH